MGSIIEVQLSSQSQKIVVKNGALFFTKNELKKHFFTFMVVYSRSFDGSSSNSVRQEMGVNKKRREQAEMINQWFNAVCFTPGTYVPI